jgi:uncharacterized membrane protein
MSSAGRAKRDREKIKQERAAVKRARRQSDGSPVDENDDPTSTAVAVKRAPQEQVLAQLALLHQRFDDGDMDFEDFEAAKSELVSQLQI